MRRSPYEEHKVNQVTREVRPEEVSEIMAIGGDFQGITDISDNANLGITLEHLQQKEKVTPEGLKETFAKNTNELDKDFLIYTFMPIPVLAQHAFDMGRLKCKIDNQN